MTAKTIDQLETFSGSVGSAYAIVRYGGVSYKTLVSNFFGATGPTGATGGPGPAGATGAAGTNGTNGTNGAAATISVGTVTSLAYGATPTIVNAGTSAAAVFNFGIPAGANGSGVPVGGTTGQVLAKTSNADGAVGWAAASSTDLTGFVQGDSGAARGRSTNKSSGNASVSDNTNPSGFFYGLAVTGMPDTGWFTWINVAGNAWSGADGYGFQLANSFLNGNLNFRHFQTGTWGAWQTLCTSQALWSREVAAGTCLAGYTYLIYGPGIVGSGMYLPASPPQGTTIRFVDMYGNWGSNSWTLYRNGQPIMGLAADMTVDTTNLNFSVVYGDTTCGWRIVVG